jgi:hypothetical protein
MHLFMYMSSSAYLSYCILAAFVWSIAISGITLNALFNSKDNGNKRCINLNDSEVSVCKTFLLSYIAIASIICIVSIYFLFSEKKTVFLLLIATGLLIFSIASAGITASSIFNSNDTGNTRCITLNDSEFIVSKIFFILYIISVFFIALAIIIATFSQS